MDNYIGRLLDGRYEILDIIGNGGMAVVYKALCHRLNRLVAVKILKDEFSRDEDFRRRFHVESQAVAMLSHPNIVSVYDVSRSGDMDYIVMELIEGITMKQYLDKKGSMNWREALHFSLQIAKALEHAHSRGIIHRDIKPHNIMILKDGSVKVADFGIAHIASSQNTLTREALGSVHYISPEQAKGGRVDNRTDLYSLGVVMYQMLTGRPPYDGESAVAVAIQHINGKLLPPTTLNSNIPNGLEQIIMKAMALAPEDRYDTATAMLKDLEAFRRDPSITFGRTPIQPKPQQPRPQPKNIAEQKANYAKEHQLKQKPKEEKNMGMIIGIVACAAVLILGLIAFMIFGGGSSQPTEPTKPTETSEQPELHTVPQFVGEYFDRIDQSKYPFLKIETEEENSDIEKGKVIRQSLEPKAEIKGDRTILLTISMGQKTEQMKDLTEKTKEYAEDWLMELKMDIFINVEKEYSADVEAGKVIRTKPKAGEQISAGDAVTLYVSSGKEPIEVPKVIGMSISNAISTLKDSKLKSDYKYVEDEADKDTVIEQSIEPGEQVQEGTQVVLTVSSGPKETEPPTEPTEPETEPTTAPTEPKTEPTTEPTDPEPVEKSISYTLELTPMEANAAVEVRQRNVVICSATLPAGESSVAVKLTGSGTVYYDIYINGTFSKIIAVDFDAE